MEQIKTIILCGGQGSRLGEKTQIIPKPLISIRRKPILWHIMKNYNHFNFSKFILCLGYKRKLIETYFDKTKEFDIEFADTGLKTGTAGRIKRVKSLVSDVFFMTYGDGLSDVNIENLLEFHLSHGKVATVTAVRPLVRFGLLDLDGDSVKSFSKHRVPTKGRIDGGFFVFNKKLFDYLDDIQDTDMLEGRPLQRLAEDNQLMAYKHDSYWHCIDTLRDLEEAKKDLNSEKNWIIWE